MQEQVDQIQNDVKEIKRALLGNKEFKQEGIIHEVKINTAFRRSVAYILGISSGIGLIIGAFWHKITSFFYV